MIERVAISDLEEIIGLKLAMFRESGHGELLTEKAAGRIRTEYRRLYLEDRAAHFIICKQGKIIACSGAFIKDDFPYSFFEPPFYGFLGDVYTVPEERGKGYATALTNAAIAWMKEKGAATIRLLASEQAKPLYRKLGFTATDEMALKLKHTPIG